MARTITVQLPENPYDVVVGENLLAGIATHLDALALPGKRCALVTDSNVGPLYAAALIETLEGAGYRPHLITIPAGEASKSLDQTETICREKIIS